MEQLRVDVGKYIAVALKALSENMPAIVEGDGETA